MMSQAQRVYFMADLWPKACKAQGWNKSDATKRYAMFAQVLGHIPRHAAKLARGEHISFNDFEQADFDAVKAHCGFLASNVKATVETDHPEIGEGRRLQHQVEEEIKCLAACLDAINERERKELQGYAGGMAYTRAILRAKFHAEHIDDLSAEPTLHDGGKRPSDLFRLLMTLRTSVQSKRKLAKLTVHEMRIRAAVPCYCRICVPKRQVVIALDNENAPF
jgi:hypothetical protein